MPNPTPTVSLVHPPRPGTRPLTAEALWRVPRVGAPVPSPDGACAAVPVTTYDLATDKGRTRLWIVPADGAAPRPLTSPDLDAREPAWSPCGRRLAFVRKGAEKDAKPQLHVMGLDGTEPEKLTDLPLGTFDPMWTHDGRAILFAAKLLRGHLTPEATRTELARRAERGTEPYVTEDRFFRYWDQWIAQGEVVHLFRLDLATRAVTDLMPSTSLWFSWMDPSGEYDLSPGGEEIAFSAAFVDGRRDLVRTGIFLLPAEGGEPRCLTIDRPGDDGRPRWAPGGASLLWGAQEDPLFYADRVRLRRHDRAADRDEEVLDWRLSPMGFEIAPDGAVWFPAEDDARQSLFRWDGTGEPAEVFRGGTVGAVAVARDGAVWFTSGSMSSPSEVQRLAPGAAAPAKLTSFADDALDGVALGEVRDVRFEGAEGETVQMYVVFPPGWKEGERRSMVHIIHGGPHGISGDTFHPRWNAHVFASWGHVVAMVNFQGSTSWGQDFAQRIQGSWGDRPHGDVMNATDALVALGWADPARLAATGASYGGYLVSWIAGHTDRFRCLVNHAGVFDSWSQYASDVTQGRARSFGGEPWDRIEALDRWSPVRHAKGFVTPMLVTHGEKDYRVPVGQGLECYSILKAKGVPARLVYLPDENHWILKPRNSIAWHGEVEAWLARWLG